MTVKFFPLFFINDLHLSPVSVQIIYLILPLLMAALNGIGEKVAKCIGRIPTSVLFKLCGLACLVTMALIKDWVAPPAAQNNTTLLDAAVAMHDGAASSPSPPPAVHWTTVYVLKALLMVVIYLVRTGLMNSTYALEQSILMDFVPKRTRARWKALSSISTFGWTGSAFLGGRVIDATDYSTTFLITAGLQFAGTLCFAVLFFIIPRRLDFEKEDEEPEATMTVEPLPAGSIQGGPVVSVSERDAETWAEAD